MFFTLLSLLFGEEISVSFIVNRLSNALKHTLFALPKDYGGYEGATEAEICFILTKVSVSFWLQNVETCQHLISDNCKGKVVLLLVGYALLIAVVLLFYIPYKLVTGSKDIIWLSMFQLLGLNGADTSNKVVVEINTARPLPTPEQQQRNDIRTARANETKQKNRRNETIAGWFVSFITFLQRNKKMTKQDIVKQIDHYQFQIEELLGENISSNNLLN